MANESIPYNLCSVTPDKAEILNEKMDAFNGRQLSFCGEVEELENYVIKDKENIIAGIKICLYFRECMFIKVLFVDEQYRGKDLGSWLLQYAEDKAKSIRIKLAHLDTFDFKLRIFILNTVLDLAKRAKEVFISSKMPEKQQLLNFVFSNLKLDGKNCC